MRIFSDIYLKTFLRLLDDYPALLTTEDLVELRLYEDRGRVMSARYFGDGPPYIKKGQVTYYPKELLVEYVKSESVNINVDRNPDKA